MINSKIYYNVQASKHYLLYQHIPIPNMQFTNRSPKIFYTPIALIPPKSYKI